MFAGDFTSGTGTPSGGSDGDFYLRTTTSQLYKKSSGTWSVVQTRFGTKGDKGDRGESGPRGNAGPTGPTGPPVRTFANDGQRTAAAPAYINQVALTLTSPVKLHYGTATTVNAWTLIPTKGDTGDTGAAGADGTLVVKKVIVTGGDQTDTQTGGHFVVAANTGGSAHTVTLQNGYVISIAAHTMSVIWSDTAYSWTLIADVPENV